MVALTAYQAMFVDGKVAAGQTVLIMAAPDAWDTGYIGWSWSGNGSGGVALDMVQNFIPKVTAARQR